MKAILVMEDGSVFEGTSIGAHGERIGEVILHTGVVGYQEIMTDPANAGKILVFTYPLIGNYGVAKKFYESRKCWTGAIIIKENSRIRSNWQSEEKLAKFLAKEDVFALSDVDTRTVAVTIRDNGQMYGIVSDRTSDTRGLLSKLNAYKKHPAKDYIKQTSVKKITELNESAKGPHIAVLDLGVTEGLLSQLKALGARLTLLPHDTACDKIVDLKPEGLLISSGPEDDEANPAITAAVKPLLGRIPMLGISAGHEIVCLALGAKLRKMKVGHHGVNYPAVPPLSSSSRGEITVQNHSFTVDESSIKDKKEITITLVNPNDKTVEEIQSDKLKIISAQYCPASPGNGEINDLFKRFFEIL